jgi:hypothetical protein
VSDSLHFWEAWFWLFNYFFCSLMSSFLSFSQSTCSLICYMIDFGPLDVGIGSDCIVDSLLKRFIIHCCYRPLLKRFIAVIVVSIRFWSTDRFIIILLKGLDCFWCIPWLHKSICHRAILVQNKLVVAKKLLVESLSSIAMATSREMQNVLRIHFPASLCQSWLCLWSYPASFSMDHW